jgi:hypothetical protein
MRFCSQGKLGQIGTSWDKSGLVELIELIELVDVRNNKTSHESRRVLLDRGVPLT